MAFEVTMEHPADHLFHVVFRCDGLGGETQDFKLPAWTPGFYQIMNYADNLQSFRAADGTGNPLTCLLRWNPATQLDN